MERILKPDREYIAGLLQKVDARVASAVGAKAGYRAIVLKHAFVVMIGLIDEGKAKVLHAAAIAASKAHPVEPVTANTVKNWVRAFVLDSRTLRKTRTVNPAARLIQQPHKRIIRQLLQNSAKSGISIGCHKIADELETRTGTSMNEITVRRFIHGDGWTYDGRKYKPVITDNSWYRGRWRRFIEVKERTRATLIIFVDETYFPRNFQPGKFWTKGSYAPTPVSSGGRMCLIAAITEDGFLPVIATTTKDAKDVLSDYHHEINADMFENWFTNLLAHLRAKGKRGRVIFMDNVAYHKRKAIPSVGQAKAGQKRAILAAAKGNSFSRLKGRKLVDAYKAHYDNQPTKIEKMATDHGHRVYYLPEYGSDANPIENGWMFAKETMKRNKIKHERKAAYFRRCVEAVKNVPADRIAKAYELSRQYLADLKIELAKFDD